MPRHSLAFSAIMMLGLSCAPAIACPWNGCGTDATKRAAEAAVPKYYYSAPLAVAPVYGYIAPKKRTRPRQPAKQ